MPQKFDTIGLIGKHGDVSPRETVIELGRFLLGRGHRVLLEENTASRVPNHKMIAASLDEIGSESDLAIVVGGDGTLLHTARSLADYEVPLLGINLGRLGFLADISPKNMLATLEQIFSGKYREESR
ncbi:MAG: NAD(+)/NADH kinase, partial [Sedimenticola sp.]|nr:NAD(+)/NADH kinase [Sedimenticola sp.]